MLSENPVAANQIFKTAQWP